MAKLEDLIVDKDEYEKEVIVRALEDKIGYSVDKGDKLEEIELVRYSSPREAIRMLALAKYLLEKSGLSDNKRVKVSKVQEEIGKDIDSRQIQAIADNSRYLGLDDTRFRTDSIYVIDYEALELAQELV